MVHHLMVHNLGIAFGVCKKSQKNLGAMISENDAKKKWSAQLGQCVSLVLGGNETRACT